MSGVLSTVLLLGLGSFGTVVAIGVVASSALVIGSVLGTFWTPSQRVLAGTLAFSSGALITALAYDLFEEAFRTAGAGYAGSGLLAGATTFVLTDMALQRTTDSDSGFALLAGVTLDGVPENLALGVTLIGSGTSILALLAAIFASNLPESLNGAKDMTDQGRSDAFAVGAWTATAVLLTVAVVAGYLVFSGVDERVLAVVRAFAGGAVLASVADTVMPEAYEDGGPLVGLATAAGFLLTFLLG